MTKKKLEGKRNRDEPEINQIIKIKIRENPKKENRNIKGFERNRNELHSR